MGRPETEAHGDRRTAERAAVNRCQQLHRRGDVSVGADMVEVATGDAREPGGAEGRDQAIAGAALDAAHANRLVLLAQLREPRLHQRQAALIGNLVHGHIGEADDADAAPRRAATQR